MITRWISASKRLLSGLLAATVLAGCFEYERFEPEASLPAGVYERVVERDETDRDKVYFMVDGHRVVYLNTTRNTTSRFYIFCLEGKHSYCHLSRNNNYRGKSVVRVRESDNNLQIDFLSSADFDEMEERGLGSEVGSDIFRVSADEKRFVDYLDSQGRPFWQQSPASKNVIFDDDISLRGLELTKSKSVSARQILAQEAAILNVHKPGGASFRTDLTCVHKYQDTGKRVVVDLGAAALGELVLGEGGSSATLYDRSRQDQVVVSIQNDEINILSIDSRGKLHQREKACDTRWSEKAVTFSLDCKETERRIRVTLDRARLDGSSERTYTANRNEHTEELHTHSGQLVCRQGLPKEVENVF